ncbi:ankyrin repeat-containing domain protein [Podospora aff. communis PSN243]|uniref:Ankyrin repeat-containing domain protein n=1 Tax=Podospora aff. communis PSN243 TaxID=3040156 RepID=A0AAV9GFY1_9PEZI|nr:ankyrin repeat-containing domain protein [Podospora aff. communis PSN243]
MAEVLAIPASAIALSQAIQLTRDAVARIYGAKDAPASAQRVRDELHQTLALVNEIDQYARDSDKCTSKEAETLLQSKLLAFRVDLNDFLAFMSPHLSQNTAWARLKLRAKWVVIGLNKKMGEMLDRISAHRAHLHLAFSLYCSYETRSSSQEVQQQLHTLSKAITANAHYGNESETITTFSGRSLQACGTVLSDAAPLVRKLIIGCSSQALLGRKGGWIISQLYALLSEVFAGSLPETTARLKERPRQVQEIASSLSGADLQDPGTTLQAGKVSTDLTVLPRGSSLISAMSIEATERDMRVHFTFASHQQSNSGGGLESLLRCRLYVASGSEAQHTGSIVQLSQANGRQPRIQRSLSGFVIHKREAPVFRAVKEGDLRALQAMLSLHLISPNDRDEEGNSLLWHAIWGDTDNNLEVCQLLLHEGADPSDANRRGDHAMAALVMQMAFPDRPLHRPFDVMKLLLNFASASDIHGTLQYKRRRGIDHVPASLLHCAVPRRRARCEALVPSVYSWLVREGGMDLEQTDKNGNTVLLYAIFYSSDIRTSWMLLDAGADVLATNKHGENALHLLCRRLSACSNPDLTNANKELVISLLARLICAGLDPLVGNHVGFTPIDAAMSPRVWPMLCSALRRCGRTMARELQLLDLAAGISLSEEYVKAKFEEAMSQRRLAGVKDCLPLEHDGPPDDNEAMVCYRCNRSAEIFSRDSPFDEFTSEIVDDAGHGMHAMYYNHPCNDECHHVNEEDSCYALDYHPAEMSKDRLVERSWRRHVAALLEDRGLLSLY